MCLDINLNNKRKRENYESPLIFLGDMNIISLRDSTIINLKYNNFYLPEELKPARTKYSIPQAWDQIVFSMDRLGIPFKILASGNFDFFKYIYKNENWKDYKSEVSNKKNLDSMISEKEIIRYFNKWRKHHMSNHLIKWVQIEYELEEER